MSVSGGLTVLATHLTAAGAALTDPILDVDRGLPTGGRAIRYYWGGEVDPPHIANRTLTGDLTGERIIIVATWPLSDLSPEQVTVIDGEMQTLAADLRSRIDGDSTLGANITDLELGYGEPDLVTIANARHVALRWDLDLAYVESTLAP